MSKRAPQGATPRAELTPEDLGTYREIIWKNRDAVMDGKGYRGRVWLSLAGHHAMKQKWNLVSLAGIEEIFELCQEHEEEIERMLNRKEVYGNFLVQAGKDQLVTFNTIMPRMRRILRCYAKILPDRLMKFTGMVQLTAILISIMPRDEEVFDLLQVLGNMMIPWYDPQNDHHRNEILLLVEVMYAKHISLCDHLTDVHFDLIDICNVTRAWVEPVFTHHFPIDFVLRALDLVFLEGPSVLVSIVYGILLLFKGDCLNNSNVDVLFTLFFNIPGALHKPKFIKEIFNKAHTLYALDDYDFFHKHRGTKSWKKCLQVPGKLNIDGTSGDAFEMETRAKRWHKSTKKQFTDDVFDKKHNIAKIEERDPIMLENEKLKSKLAAEHKKVQQLHRKNLELQRERVSLKRNQSCTLVPIPVDLDGNPLSATTTNDVEFEDVDLANLKYNGLDCSYKLAMNSIKEPCIFMQGYLCKVNGSSNGSLFQKKERLQSRWFVLKGKYLTYFKSHLKYAPSSDRCLDLTDYVIQACRHELGEFGIELISPRKPDSNLRKRFVLLCTYKDQPLAEKRRDNWVKALKIASKNPSFLSFLDPS